MRAVLTGDIVNSTHIKPEDETKLLHELRIILAPYLHEFFRGDSFQLYVPEPEKALTIALLCRTAAIRLIAEDAEVTADVRLSLALGAVKEPVLDLSTAKGDAFVMSGRTLDDLGKSGGHIAIVTNDKLPAVALAVLSDYINSIFRQLTPKQAEVTHELLQGLNQQQVADKLNRSKSTISQHVTAGRWEEIEKILVNYEKIAQLISL